MSQDIKLATPGTTGGVTASPAATTGQSSLFAVPRVWKFAGVGGAIMVLLALGGVALTSSASSAAETYWISLVPVYGIICIGIAFVRNRYDGHARRPAVVRQAFHWLGIGLALGLDFYIRKSGVETATAAGMNALLLLALGCFLAGIHLEWLFVVVGLVLGLALVIVSKSDQYMWLIFVVGGLAAAAMLFLAWRLHVPKKTVARTP